MSAKEKYRELEQKTDSLLSKLIDSPLTLAAIVAVAILLVVLGAKLF